MADRNKAKSNAKTKPKPGDQTTNVKHSENLSAKKKTSVSSAGRDSRRKSSARDESIKQDGEVNKEELIKDGDQDGVEHEDKRPESSRAGSATKHQGTHEDGQEVEKDGKDRVEEDETSFEKSYDHVKEQNRNGLQILVDVRSELESQMEMIRDKSLKELFKNKESFNACKSGVTRVRKMLQGTGKYMEDDYSKTAANLKEILEEYSAAIHEKLKNEFVPFTEVDQSEEKSKSDLQAQRRETEALESSARLAIQLKEMEQLAADIQSSADRLAAAMGEGGRTAGGVEGHLNAIENQESEKQVENEEERLRREEEMKAAKEEEERRKQEEEEERIRLEEEKKRRMEEEERKRCEEEERLKKEDPRFWPGAIVYELGEDSSLDYLGSGIGCVLRVPETVTIDKGQLSCQVLDIVDSPYQLSENEELAGNVIILKTANGRDFDLRDTNGWFAFPFTSSSRTREVVIKFQEIQHRPPTPPEKQDTEKPEEEENHAPETTPTPAQTSTPTPPTPTPPAPTAPVTPTAPAKTVPPANRPSTPVPLPWKEVMTRETTVEGQESVKFAETHISHLSSDGMNVIILTRPKRDTEKFNNKGGKLTSSVDPRVIVTVPKNAFRLTTDITLQVSADFSILTGLKERYDHCEALIGLSPVVSITMNNKPQKPLTLTITHPSGGNKLRRQGTTAEGSKKNGGSSLPPSKSDRMQSSDSGDDFVVLMVRDVNGKWKPRDDIPMEQLKDSVSFQLPDVADRLVLLRTNVRIEPLDLARMAIKLESSMLERPAVLLAKQKADDPTKFFLECCKRDSVDRIAQKLREDQYVEGPEPSYMFCLREGDVIQVSFRGNIDIEDRKPRKIVFNSNFSSAKLSLDIRELDSFAQNALDVYRGFVRVALVDRPYVSPPKLARVEDGKKGKTADAGLICELPVTLPKPVKELAVISRVELPIIPDEPLDLAKMTIKLETSMLERPAVLLAKQKADDPTKFFLECCKRDSVDRIAQKLREDQYVEGPDPSNMFCLREGDVIQVSFRGNIDIEDRKPRKIVFNSNLSFAKLSLDIRELDSFAQNALDVYRGFVRVALVDRPYVSPPKLARVEDGKKGKTADAGLICELPVTLPKPVKELAVISRVELPIIPDGPLTAEYFDQLSVDLGDEWIFVAERLKLNKASIQRIIRSFSNLDDATEATQRSIKQMLTQWYKSSARSKNKADELRQALVEAGRNDLAEDLAMKNKEFRNDSIKRQEEARLEGCIKAYNDSEAAVKLWKSVAKSLGLTEEHISANCGDQGGEPTKEYSREMLLKWRELKGENASRDNLIVVLKKLKLNEAVCYVSQVR